MEFEFHCEKLHARFTSENVCRQYAIKSAQKETTHSQDSKRKGRNYYPCRDCPQGAEIIATTKIRYRHVWQVGG